jgi:F-type H+-transporting ATPase subunit epsilon
MSVQLVAVERRLWSGTGTFVSAQTTEGEIGILPGHEPVRTTDGETVTAAVQGGFLSVTGDAVSILAESADLASEIDVEAARADLSSEDAEARVRAQGRLRAAGQRD